MPGKLKSTEASVKISDLFKVEGYGVVVKGGASGIGLGYAEALASNGAKVTILDVDARGTESETKRLRDAGLDIRGQICPSTLLVALREMNNNIDELDSGSVRLFIKTDNRDAINTIPEAAENMGFQVNVAKAGSFYTILIFK